MPYRVGLDIRMLQRSGIGTYLRGLTGGFKEIGFGGDAELGFFGINTPEPFSAPIYSIREQLAYPALLRACRLWHSPHYNVPLLKGGTKLVVTIHDIIHWIFRKELLNGIQAAYAGYMLRRAVALSDHIITSSQHTKEDLLTHFHADEQKISVIPLGVDAQFRKLSPDVMKAAFEKLQKTYRIPDNYFLYVGLLKPHKNVQWLIRLFRKLREDGKVGAALVLVGRKDKQYPRDYEELARLTSTKEVIHINGLKHDELPVLYNQALALVHPSIYEGFGLTLLEAMACGTPVITTHAASIPEVVGNSAVLVDTASEKGMVHALMRIEGDPSLRSSLRQKGFERARHFRWEETARRTAEIYEKVLS